MCKTIPMEKVTGILAQVTPRTQKEADHSEEISNNCDWVYAIHKPNPYHPCMVYLPTFCGFLTVKYGTCRYIDIPYMDAMGKTSKQNTYGYPVDGKYTDGE